MLYIHKFKIIIFITNTKYQNTIQYDYSHYLKSSKYFCNILLFPTKFNSSVKIKTFSKDETSIIMESAIIFSDAEERGADLDMALALLSSAKDKQMAVKCAETIVKIVKNIANDPTEKKYQKLMLKGKTVREKILMIAGGADVLVAIGFTLTSDRLGIILKYDELDDMLLATLFSIIEAGNQFIEDNKM